MTVTVRTKVSTKDIDEAYLRLKNIVKETPLQFDHYLSQKYNCNVYLKREDLQWVRSFKLRGAYNAISVLSNEEKNKGLYCKKTQFKSCYFHASNYTTTKNQSSQILRG